MKKSTKEAINEFVRLVGGKTWIKTAKRCTGDWRGTTDYYLLIDKRISLFVSNGMQSFEDRIRVWINNIETFFLKKNEYLRILRIQAQKDNVSARKEGLNEVEIIDIGIISPEVNAGYYFLQPYVLLEVSGRRYKFHESSLSCDILSDRLDRWEEKSQKAIRTAGAVKDPDHIFGGVRYNSQDNLYCIK